MKFDIKDWGLIAIRGLAISAEFAGRINMATTLFRLADRIEAGENVDGHMSTVAQLLKDRTVNDEDWRQVRESVISGSGRLQGE